MKRKVLSGLWLATFVVLRFPCGATLRAQEPLNLAPNGSFELDRERLGGWLPLGAVKPASHHGVSIVGDVARTGKRCLRITPGPKEPVRGLEFFADYNGGEGKRTVTVGGGVRGARTIAMRLGADTAALAAAAWVKRPPGSSFTLSAVWTGRRDRRPVVEIHRDKVAQPSRGKDGWELWELAAVRPHDGLQVQLWLETDAQEPVWVDDVRLYFTRAPGRRLLVDQLGYEASSKVKRVIMQSTTPLESPPAARLIDLVTFKEFPVDPWVKKGYLAAWDLYHWSADFSSLRRPGRYVVAIGRGRRRLDSPPFSIADDLLVAHTGELAYRFYFWQRCGTAVPGSHGPCHMDDARLADGTWRDLTGGWHDAGDYNKYCGLTPEAVYSLALAYHFKPTRFRGIDRDANGLADILDEALWGAQFVRKMLDEEKLELLDAVFSGYRYWGRPERETDNRPGTADDRPVRAGRGDPTWCAAGFAILGKHVAASDNEELAKHGRHLLDLAERLHAKFGGGVEQIGALFAATGKIVYAKAARSRASDLLAKGTGFRELAWFALYFPEDPLARSPSIRSAARRRVDELLRLCDERFGVARRPASPANPPASPTILPGPSFVYCRAYGDVNDWYVGETGYRLDTAIEGLLAARLGDDRGRRIATDQVHWILGRNPLGVSLMEGVGSHFVPAYHHRYNTIPGNPRGAVPGSILNGFVRAWPHVDRPWLDLSPEPNADYHANEQWLLQNNRWLVLLALW